MARSIPPPIHAGRRHAGIGETRRLSAMWTAIALSSVVLAVHWAAALGTLGLSSRYAIDSAWSSHGRALKQRSAQSFCDHEPERHRDTEVWGFAIFRLKAEAT